MKKVILGLLFASLLTACGGGGSDSPQVSDNTNLIGGDSPDQANATLSWDRGAWNNSVWK